MQEPTPSVAGDRRHDPDLSASSAVEERGHETGDRASSGVEETTDASRGAEAVIAGPRARAIDVDADTEALAGDPGASASIRNSEIPATRAIRTTGLTDDESSAAATVVEPLDLSVMTAALARLGPEGLIRLRARHAEVLARISEKVEDPARREELKAQAERLNPDTWVTGPDVTEGLERYEAVFESLRSVVGRRRKRRRRRVSGSGAANGGPAGASDEPDAGDADSPGEPESDL